MMDKKLLTIAVIILLLVSVGVYMFFFPMERVTEERPYMIEDVHDLQDMNEDLDAHYALANDIDASETEEWNDGEGFSMVGTRNDPFTGTFDGHDYTIRNLFIDRSEQRSAEYVGLFGHLADGGEIRNINLFDVQVSGSTEVGGLVGVNEDGTVSDSHVTGEVRGRGPYDFITAGGLVGNNEGTVTNSQFTDGLVTAPNAGGLVGRNKYSGTVENSFFDIDSVRIDGVSRVDFSGLYEEQFQDWISNDMNLDVSDYYDKSGQDHYEIDSLQGLKDLLGFAGEEEYSFRLTSDIDLSGEDLFHVPYLEAEFDGDGHTIENLSINVDHCRYVGFFGYIGGEGKVSNLSLVHADVRGRIFAQVGILAGENRGTIFNSNTGGTVSGDVTSGGLAGTNEGKVMNSFSTAEVNGDKHAGGLIAWNPEGMVLSSYATGDVNGGRNVGGLLGYNRGVGVYNSFATGDVDGSQWVGGLIGSQYGGTIANSYSTGEVSGNQDIGGLVGYNRDDENESVKNSFWNEDTSGQSTSDGGTGKTTEEMKDQELFSEAGWDITVVEDEDELDAEYRWNIVEGETYPFLSGKEAEPVEEDDDPIDGGIFAAAGLILMGLVVVYLVMKDDRENEGEDVLQSEKADESSEEEDLEE